MGGVTLTGGVLGDELEVAVVDCDAVNESLAAVLTLTLRGDPGCVRMRGSRSCARVAPG